MRVNLDDRKIDLDYAGRDGEQTPAAATPDNPKSARPDKRKRKR